MLVAGPVSREPRRRLRGVGRPSLEAAQPLFLSRRQTLLPAQFGRQWSVNLPFAGRVSVVPEAVLAVSVVIPAGKVDDWVETDTGDGHTGSTRTPHFPSHIA